MDMGNRLTGERDKKFTICLPNLTVLRKLDGKALERLTVSVLDLTEDQFSVGRIRFVIVVPFLPPMGPIPLKTGTKLYKTEHRSVLDGDCQF